MQFQRRNEYDLKKNACRLDRATLSTVIRRRLIAKVQVQAQGRPRGTCVGRSGAGTGSSLSTSVSSSQHFIRRYIFIYQPGNLQAKITRTPPPQDN